MGGRPAAFGVIERVTGNSVLCSVLEVTKSKYGISPNTETPYLRGLLVEVTGLELKDLIIAIYRTFRKSPILRTLR